MLDTAQYSIAASEHSMDRYLETAGNGGYGRLGHVKQQDEFKPRNVETFNQRVPVAPDMVSPLHALVLCIQTGHVRAGGLKCMLVNTATN